MEAPADQRRSIGHQRTAPMASRKRLGGTIMMHDETRRLAPIVNWLGDIPGLRSSILRQGFLQEDAGRLFPWMRGEFGEKENILHVLRALKQISDVLSEGQVGAVAMALFPLRQVRAAMPVRHLIELSVEADAVHPPSLYVLANDLISVLPIGLEFRAPMVFSPPAGFLNSTTCFMTASLAEPGSENEPSPEWDRDVRVIAWGLGAGCPQRNYGPAYAGRVNI